MEQIYLTRRNLLTLLSKLDRKKKGDYSKCTIIKCDYLHKTYPQTMKEIRVTALEDEEYYTDREPGPIHKVDEEIIVKLSGT